MDGLRLEGIKEAKTVYRGEIYYAKLFGAIGSEQKGKRPVLVVQNNIGNMFSTTTLILPITKKIDIKDTQPTHIEIKNFEGLKYESVILAEQIRTIDKIRLCEKIGCLNYEMMKKVEKAMKIAQGMK